MIYLGVINLRFCKSLSSDSADASWPVVWISRSCTAVASDGASIYWASALSPHSRAVLLSAERQLFQACTGQRTYRTDETRTLLGDPL